MVTQNQLLLDKLQSIHDRALSATSRKLLYLTIAEYMDLFDKEPVLEPISKDIVSLGHKDKQHIKELEEKALVEMSSVYKTVKTYIDARGVSNPVVNDNLAKYKAYDDETIASSDGPIKGRYGFLTYALMTLTESENGVHIEFTKRYGNISPEGRILGWNFSLSYDKWTEATKIMRRIEETKIWFSWDRLAIFYILFNHKEKIEQEQYEKHKLWDMYGTHLMFREIEDILAGRKPGPGHQEYDDETYKAHLQRVHAYVKEYFDTPQKPDKESNKQYSLKDNILTINGKEIKLKKDTRKLRLLTLLVSRRSAVYYSEITEEMEGAVNELKDPKNTYYEICRGISNTLIKVGITDFLEFDYNHAKINLLYRKRRN